jgi:uncharacterized protein YgiM (DUF1202 family)
MNFVVKPDRLNVRTGPDFAAPIITVIEKGRRIERIGADRDWLHVRGRRPKSGFRKPAGA